MTDRERPRLYDAIVLALLFLALGALFVIDLYAIPEHIPATIIYALPVIAAALRLRPRLAAIVVGAAVASNIIEFIQMGVIFWSWVVAGATILIIGYLSIRSAEQTRRAEASGRELLRLQTERQAFTALVAHELKGIMTVISGYTETLQGWERMTEERRTRAITTIIDQTHRLNRLVGELSDTSAIETGKFVLHRQPCDLVATAKGTVEENQIVTGKHKLLLQTDESALVGQWDCGRIRQVLDNLVSNAIKYSPAGGEIRILIGRSVGAATVAVKDQGSGIPPESLGNLFKPYYRLPSSGDIKGLGLGLYIVKQIVEAHGGRVQVESTVGVGTVFHVELPLDRSTAGEHSIA